MIIIMIMIIIIMIVIIIILSAEWWSETAWNIFLIEVWQPGHGRRKQ